MTFENYSITNAIIPLTLANMEKHFDRNLDSLPLIVEFLEDVKKSQELDAGAFFVLNMVVEELYTNMVKYNGNGADHILIGVEEEDDRMVIRLVDFDSEPFDYTSQSEVNVSASLHERTPGGLGIHLVKRFMDEVSYEYKDRKTSIRLVKYLNSNA